MECGRLKKKNQAKRNAAGATRIYSSSPTDLIENTLEETIIGKTDN